MNTIKGNIAIGAPYSEARYKAAKEARGACVCGDCIKKHEQNGRALIIDMGFDKCYVCEASKENCYSIL